MLPYLPEKMNHPLIVAIITLFASLQQAKAQAETAQVSLTSENNVRSTEIAQHSTEVAILLQSRDVSVDISSSSQNTSSGIETLVALNQQAATQNIPTAQIPLTATVYPTFTAYPTFTPYPTYTPPPPPPTYTAIPPADFLYKQDFNDPSNVPGLEGPVGLVENQLAMDIKNGDYYWYVIPVRVGQNFYIQAKMTLGTALAGCWPAMGFALGEKGGSQHRFLLYHTCGNAQIGYFDNNTPIFSAVSSNGGWITNAPRNIALEAKDGIFTFYVDGAATISKPIKAYGGDIGIFAWAQAGGGPMTYLFDDILLKESR